MLDNVEVDSLIEAAKKARELAYAPYSKFRVGAAVKSGSGKIYTGCNIENASYGLTICAERVAVFNAISAGETTISVVVIVAGDEEIARPCGACLQVISEFASTYSDNPTLIIASSANGDYDIKTISDYLPMRFHLD